MRIVVISGINGSGKTTALRALEDIGFYAIDNLPIDLLDKLLELFRVRGEIEKLALVADTRGAHKLDQVPLAIESAKRSGHYVQLLMLDASDDVVGRRYSETRRRHPLAEGSESVKDGIARERKLLEPLREAADITFDTTGLSVHDTKRAITKLFSAEQAVQLGITVESFGFKNGVPVGADLLFDVRFLPNPYFVEALRPLTGVDEACASHVLDQDRTRAFLDRLTALLEFLIPEYEREGKAYLTIGIGCTGGRHRSVAIAEWLGRWLGGLGRSVRVRHRDTPEAERALPPTENHS